MAPVCIRIEQQHARYALRSKFLLVHRARGQLQSKVVLIGGLLVQAKLYPEYIIAKMPSNVMQDLGSESPNELIHDGKEASQHADQLSSATKSSLEPSSGDADAGAGGEFVDNDPSNSQRDKIVDCCNLLANAPVHRDHYDYHVDADPLTLPESTWRQAFGDYCNRYCSSNMLMYTTCLFLTLAVVFLRGQFPPCHTAFIVEEI